MIKFQAVNDVIILIKDKDEHNSPLILPEQKSMNPSQKDSLHMVLIQIMYMYRTA